MYLHIVICDDYASSDGLESLLLFLSSYRGGTTTRAHRTHLPHTACMVHDVLVLKLPLRRVCLSYELYQLSSVRHYANYPL